MVFHWECVAQVDIFAPTALPTGSLVTHAQSFFSSVRVGRTEQISRTISLYGACSEDILVQRSLRYWSESGYYRMRVDGRIQFKYASVDGEIFESGKKKFRIQKYPDTRERGLRNPSM